jgi:hypothetical protein
MEAACASATIGASVRHQQSVMLPYAGMGLGLMFGQQHVQVFYLSCVSFAF